MYLDRGKFTFKKKRRDRPSRIVIYLILIAIGIFIVHLRQTEAIAPPFVPTPTATRSAVSFAREAEAHFSSGKLERAITSYVQATRSDATNPDYWIALARLQVYANLLKDALESADTAVFINVENSMAHAVRALALDWLGEYDEAAVAAARAIQLDGNNALAHAYYAEILTDISRYAQAGDEARLAIDLNPNSMDVHRVYGYYLENVAAYEKAIDEYHTAATINPNMAMLYMRLGLNYRVLGDYDTAIEYFQRASALDPNDVMPYLSISRTYFQIGEYNRSSEYLERALELEPENADVYGRLGLVEFKALNYENATIDLGCAVEGCTHPRTNAVVEGLALGRHTLEYYYTFGSVLAAYLQCDRAMTILVQVSAYAPEDEIVQGIVEENINICATVEATGAQFAYETPTPPTQSATAAP
ncbi:MAG TPA: tetratricopeptide repeat protein [Anaerolineales bacterium]|jgi:tetratricopeptide (TPR) repeat protein|nr:tetratricopeptide repeat protein [Anaerolineales bacterium]